MKHKRLRYIGPLIAATLLVVSVVVLRKQLKTYHWQDLTASIAAISYGRLFLAACLTSLSYLTLTLYDFLATRYVGERLPYWKTAMASFSSYALANTIGFSVVSGMSIRYYYYSSWGLSVGKVSRIVGFCVVTGWVGLLTLSGLVLTFEHDHFSNLSAAQSGYEYLLGILLLGIVAAYFISTFFWAKSFTIFKREIPLPGPKIALGQLLVSSFDWILIASVLYCLLPATEELTFPVVLGMLLLGQSVGSLSQVPGGLGVFETAMLVMVTSITGTAAIPQVMSALLVYRGIYYLLPFITAGIILGTHGAFFPFFSKTGPYRSIALFRRVRLSWIRSRRQTRHRRPVRVVG